MKQAALMETGERSVPAMDRGNKEKKKRLTNNQIELLERSFQEEIKLDPERKMKLSRELGLQPRQIAVWFQNRRTRWKTKQLEHLYDMLKHQYDVVSNEKQKLQEEVPSHFTHVLHTYPCISPCNSNSMLDLELFIIWVLPFRIERSLHFKFEYVVVPISCLGDHSQKNE